MTASKVSIIIPIYNTSRYLERCITSVREQTLTELQIILVDDGSTDNSPEIADNYAFLDQRIIVIHKENQGLGWARNSGINVATSEYVAFLDSDDFVEKDMYQILYHEATKNKADTCLCGYKLFDSGKVTEQITITNSNQLVKGKEVINKVLFPMLGGTPCDSQDDMINMSVWHGIYSLEIIKKHNIRFPSERELISEDIIYDIEYFSYSNATLLITNALYFYCMNETSLSRRFRKDRYEMFKKLYFEELERVPKFNRMEESELRIRRKFLGNVRYQIQHIVSVLPRKEALSQIHQICYDIELQNILKQYPINKNPKPIYLFNIMLKNKSKTGIWFLVKLKSEVKKIE